MPWTDAEVQALRDGVAAHGAGKWANILKDGAFVASRTGVHLKDKCAATPSRRRAAALPRPRDTAPSRPRDTALCARG